MKNFDNDDDNDDLVPDHYIQALNMELLVHPEEQNDPERTAKRLMRDVLPAVTMAVTKAALYDTDPRVRLSAAGMIFDRVLGKAGTTSTVESSPQEALYQAMMEDIQVMLQTAANN